MSKKKKIQFSIGFKLITITSIIVALALGGMIFLASWFFRDDNKMRVRENTLQLAELMGQQVEINFEAVVDKVGIIGSLLQGHREDVERMQEIFNGDKDIVFAAVAAKNDKGESYIQNSLINSSLAPGFAADPKFILDRVRPLLAIFEGSFAGKYTVMNPTVELSELELNVLAIAVPYQMISSAEASSILVILIQMDRFASIVKSEGIMRAYIVNAEGKLLAHYDQSQVREGGDYSGKRIVQAMQKSGNSNQHIRYEEDGHYYLASFQKIDFAGVGAVVYVDEDEAFAAVYAIQRRNILITVLVLNLAILIVFLFAKTITRPVKRLMDAALQVKEGDYALNIKATTRDEIGNLTDSFVEMAEGLAERERMKEAFGKFVNKEIAERAMKGELKLGGELRDVAIFFSDIRSFTAISESLTPEGVVEFLNDYMTRMVACVNKTNGVVDKFIGDAIMAVWGTPVSYGNDIENAVNAALMMRLALLEFNSSRGGPGKPIIRNGCGINVGPVVAGQIGSHERMEYTVIGDAVNLASRIEALNKPFGTDILISQDAYERVHDIYITQAMKKIKVKGKTAPQSVYAIIGRRDDPHAPRSLDEVRQLVGIDMSHVDLGKDVDEGEVKYEIIE